MTTFKKLTSADIPNTFSGRIRELILLAMDNGGVGRLSTKGHIIVRAPSGQTIAFSRNAGNGYKRLGNQESEFKKAFPNVNVPEIEDAPTIGMKMCAKCKEHKPFDDFTKNRRAKDGLQSYCRECMKIANRERYAKNHPPPKSPVETGRELAEAQRKREGRDQPKPKTDELAQDAYTEVHINSILVKELNRLREENKKLRLLFDAIIELSTQLKGTEQ